MRTNEILKWSGLNNCRQNRKRGAKCCQDCPFKDEIEQVEKKKEW